MARRPVAKPKPAESPRAWQRMLSGRRLDLLNPSPLDIEIEDIAQGLSRVARWNGQTSGDWAFTVAQHSLVVDALVGQLKPLWPAPWRLATLLHDGAEYVLGDLITPFKSQIGRAYKDLENRLLGAIHLRFGLPAALPPAVGERDQARRQDRRLLRGDAPGRLRRRRGAALLRPARPHRRPRPDTAGAGRGDGALPRPFPRLAGSADMTWLVVLAGLPVAAWLYLLLAHGRFWLADQRLPQVVPRPANPPSVVALVPARNEAAVVGEAVASLLAQDYPGTLEVVLVDDGSTDGTAEVARLAAAASGRAERLTVLSAPEREPGWVGKLWAVESGRRAWAAGHGQPDYWWLTDADIGHAPEMLSRLVNKAEEERRALVSLMALLWCRSLWERLLIPPFVFFFQKLYPFPRVNEDRNKVAAAAGGCVLVRADTLAHAGGTRAHQGRADRRLRAGAAHQAGGAPGEPRPLGRAHAQVALAASLPGPGRYLADGGAFRLHAAPPLPAPAAGHAPRHGAALPRAALAGAALALARRRCGGIAGARRLAADGGRDPADPAPLRPILALGPHAAAGRHPLRRDDLRQRAAPLARPRRHLEGPGGRR